MCWIYHVDIWEIYILLEKAQWVGIEGDWDWEVVEDRERGWQRTMATMNETRKQSGTNNRNPK